MFNLAVTVLKIVLLASLYIFIFATLRTVYLDLAARDKPNPRLVALKGAVARGTCFHLSGEIVVGREVEDGLALSDPYISGRHARIFPDSEGYAIEDLGSTNGVYLNGRRLQTIERLEPGDRIKLGDTTLQYME